MRQTKSNTAKVVEWTVAEISKEIGDSWKKLADVKRQNDVHEGFLIVYKIGSKRTLYKSSFYY